MEKQKGRTIEAQDYQSTIYAFYAEQIDVSKIIDKIVEKDENIMIAVNKPDVDAGETESYYWHYMGGSSTGLDVIVTDQGLAMIIVPHLASKSDVELAFRVLRKVKELQPGTVICDNDPDKVADLSEENMLNEVKLHYHNLTDMIVKYKHNVVMLPGFHHDYYLDAEFLWSKRPNATLEEITEDAMKGIIEIRSLYNNYENASVINLSKSGSDKIEQGRIIFNEKLFVASCDNVVLSDTKRKQTKICSFYSFRDAIKGHEYIKMVDGWQFIIDKMPDEEWLALFEKVPDKTITRRKVYLMRWNPTFSSFTLDAYREVIARTKPGYGFGIDWSIYEAQEAQEGDEYFMLRTGDDKAGIIFHGYFESDPYKTKAVTGLEATRCATISTAVHSTLPEPTRRHTSQSMSCNRLYQASTGQEGTRGYCLTTSKLRPFVRYGTRTLKALSLTKMTRPTRTMRALTLTWDMGHTFSA